MFLIGARILSGSLSAARAGDVFAELADVLIRALKARVEEDFIASHGRIRGEEIARIVALGRLGAREMTATSDLDLMVIYDFDGEEPELDGKRRLYGAVFCALYPTPDQRAHRANQLWRLVSSGYAPAALWTLRPAGDAH